MSNRFSLADLEEKILSDPKKAPKIGLFFAILLGFAAFFFKFGDPITSALAGYILPLSLHFSLWMKKETEKREQAFDMLNQRWMDAAFTVIATNFEEATRRDATVWKNLALTTRTDPFPFIYANLVNVVAGTIRPAQFDQAEEFKLVPGLTIYEKRNHLEASVIFWRALAQYTKHKKEIDKKEFGVDVFVTHFFNPKYWSGKDVDPRDNYLSRHMFAQREFLNASENDGIYRMFCKSIKDPKTGELNFNEEDYVGAVNAHKNEKEQRMYATIVRSPDEPWPENLDFVYVPSLKIAVIWKNADARSLSIDVNREPDQLVMVDLNSVHATVLHQKIKQCLLQCRQNLSNGLEKPIFEEALKRALSQG